MKITKVIRNNDLTDNIIDTAFDGKDERNPENVKKAIIALLHAFTSLHAMAGGTKEMLDIMFQGSSHMFSEITKRQNEHNGNCCPNNPSTKSSTIN